MMKNLIAILCNYLSIRVILWIFCLIYGIFLGVYYDKTNLGFFTDSLVNNIAAVNINYGN